MTFSVRSFSRSPSAVAAVPLMGPDESTPPSSRRNSSGEAVTTHTGSIPLAAGTWIAPA